MARDFEILLCWVRFFISFSFALLFLFTARSVPYGSKALLQVVPRRALSRRAFRSTVRSLLSLILSLDLFPSGMLINCSSLEKKYNLNLPTYSGDAQCVLLHREQNKL